MDADALQTAIEDDYETELSRLGSSKALYAVTGGEMEAEEVLPALADRSLAAAETFDGWAADASGDAADLYASLADGARERARRIGDAGDVDPSDQPTPLESSLRGLEQPAERLGGLLAWALVTDATLSQAVGFFVGSADPSSANRFRDLRSGVDADRERVLETMDDSLADDDWDRAAAAAGDAVETAYAHYVDVLEGMGIKVKPVC